MAEQSLGVNTELKSQHTPEFDGGNFTIEYLSTSSGGFEVATDQSYARRKDGSPLPLDTKQRMQLRMAMADQIKFAEGDKAKEALDKLRNADEEEKTAAMEEYQKRRKVYHKRATPLIGLRHVRREGDKLTVDIRVVDYPTYQEFSNENSTSELIDFAAPSSTSIMIITKDQRLIVQHRSARNKLYGDVPGASAAGYFNGKFYQPGVFFPITTDSVKENAIKETNEEIGLEKEDLANISIIALSRERLKIHDDILFLARTDLTAGQMKDKALKASDNIKLSEEEFDEKFIDIPATLESIETILSKLQCPLPPTHVAIFVATGFNMILQEKGLGEANKWRDRMQQAVRKNYQEINQIVERYYETHPEELNNIPKGKPARNPHGYEPAYLPQEQGLPDFTSELTRLGLIANNNDIIKVPEIMKTVDRM